MSVRILTGDCRDVLKTLPDESVHCVVTSPPYFGLRDYGTATWEGGDPECDHAQQRRERDPESKQATSHGSARDSLAGRNECRKCGAIRIDSQIGLEPTPDEYVAAMVAVFREVWRVLRKDGTVWLNLGDSYAAQRGGTHQPAETLAGGVGGKTNDGNRVNSGRFDGINPTRNASSIGLKHKDLIGIPWRVAFALQADGWWLRQDIIWSKPNPMPESVTDRCTKAHEYIFMLTKSARYYFDDEAIAEPASFVVPADRAVSGDYSLGSGRNDHGGHRSGGFVSGETRNRRSVWTVTTQPFKEAHFATFPPKLIEPCILAGSPPGGTVLDPFGGAGTTGLVADRLGRGAVLIELNPDYATMAEKRLHEDAGMFCDIGQSPTPLMGTGEEES